MEDYLYSETQKWTDHVSDVCTPVSGYMLMHAVRSEETVQTGKKPGMQVTAYKILVKLGLEESVQ